jgi:hypothetical protein
VSDDLRERALTAAKAEADQKAHERAEYEERVQQWEDQLLDAAQAECEWVLGVRAEFLIWRVPHHDSGYTGEVAARADIEGINVTYRLRRDMDGNGYWGSLGSSGHNELAPLQPHADERRGYHYEWQLSHDLESFGAALLEAEERARKTAESEAVKEANMRRRYPDSICPVRPARGFLV